MSPITLSVNGADYSIEVEPTTPLLWVLRDKLGLTGTKFGCGIGMCGACTVLVDGRAMRSCSTSAASVTGTRIITIEGLSPDGSHPVQRAWIAEQVPQCGYCQPGQILTAVSLLKNNPRPTEQEINQAMSGTLCRCGTYNRIKAAIQRVIQEGAMV